HQPGPLQIYAIQGHIAWEQLDESVRKELYSNLGWLSGTEALGAGVLFEYIPGYTDLTILQTGDGRDFDHPTIMRIRPETSDWTIEIRSGLTEIQALICLSEKLEYKTIEVEEF